MSSSRNTLDEMLSRREPPLFESSPREFYRTCVERLMGSGRFECLAWDDDSTGSTFFTYLLFPRDERSLRLDAVVIRGTGLFFYLGTEHSVAAYGAMNVFTGSHSGGAGFLNAENIQSLPSPDWADVETELCEILQTHGIAVLTREDAMVPLRSLGLLPPEQSNMAGAPATLFYAFFNNDY